MRMNQQNLAISLDTATLVVLFRIIRVCTSPSSSSGVTHHCIDKTNKKDDNKNRIQLVEKKRATRNQLVSHLVLNLAWHVESTCKLRDTTKHANRDNRQRTTRNSFATKSTRPRQAKTKRCTVRSILPACLQK